MLDLSNTGAIFDQKAVLLFEVQMNVAAGSSQSVRIHIDEERYESPTPTTGVALYALGNVPPGKELFREVSGDREDELVPRNEAPIQLKEDEHFHSARALSANVRETSASS